MKLIQMNTARSLFIQTSPSTHKAATNHKATMILTARNVQLSRPFPAHSGLSKKYTTPIKNGGSSSSSLLKSPWIISPWYTHKMGNIPIVCKEIDHRLGKTHLPRAAKPASAASQSSNVSKMRKELLLHGRALSQPLVSSRENVRVRKSTNSDSYNIVLIIREQ